MPVQSVAIRPFDFAYATDSEYIVLNRHMNRSRAETLPDDPPTPLEDTITQMQNIPPVVAVHAWAGWEGEEMVASGVVSFMRTPENAHLASFDLYVYPEYRRQGIGRALLRHAASFAQSEERRLLMTDTNERVSAGEAFMKRLGAERGLSMHTNQLTLADLDHHLLGQWKADAEARAFGFTLRFWDGPFPEERLEAIAEIYDVMNTAPRDGLDMEDTHTTPEQLRQMDQSMLASGRQRWTFYVSEPEAGSLVGFTDMYLNPSNPDIVNQGFTGVSPSVRGKGIGRWLKAAMLERIVRDRPQACFVRTGNADSNAAMLGINHALGFKPYLARCVWQVETEKVLRYLSES